MKGVENWFFENAKAKKLCTQDMTKYIDESRKIYTFLEKGK
jgi:hypothetical protein